MWTRSKSFGEAAGLTRRRSQSQPWFYWLAESPRLLFLGYRRTVRKVYPLPFYRL
jgi:hypothetical protein